MTNQEIIEQIHTELNNVHTESNIHGRKAWTLEFFRALSILNRDKMEGFKVYTCLRELTTEGLAEKGWLFDLCWSKEGKEKDGWKTNYTGLKLICESEWNTSEDEIKHDFQKLAVAKAEIKIMIVQYNTDDQFLEIKKWCEESVHESLHNDGSDYILVGSGNNSKLIGWSPLWK